MSTDTVLPDTHESMKKFVGYASALKGDEKGEAQVFCDRLFQAFGHEGFKGAGAEAESRQKQEKGTNFIDLLWKPRLLIEMKKRGEKLQKCSVSTLAFQRQAGGSGLGFPGDFASSRRDISATPRG